MVGLGFDSTCLSKEMQIHRVARRDNPSANYTDSKALRDCTLLAVGVLHRNITDDWAAGTLAFVSLGPDARAAEIVSAAKLFLIRKNCSIQATLCAVCCDEEKY